jgi:hypothetical protein
MPATPISARTHSKDVSLTLAQELSAFSLKLDELFSKTGVEVGSQNSRKRHRKMH